MRRLVLVHKIKYVLQSQKVRRPETRHPLSRISANDNVKRDRHRGTNKTPSGDGQESLSAAVRVRPRCDVIQACKPTSVQPGIEEAERGPTT